MNDILKDMFKYYDTISEAGSICNKLMQGKVMHNHTSTYMLQKQKENKIRYIVKNDILTYIIFRTHIEMAKKDTK